VIGEAFLSYITPEGSEVEPEEKLIHFQKHMAIASVLQEVKRFQSFHYQIEPIPELTHYLLRVKGFSDDHERTAMELCRRINNSSRGSYGDSTFVTILNIHYLQSINYTICINGLHYLRISLFQLGTFIDN
jgi:hypothetical protein